MYPFDLSQNSGSYRDYVRPSQAPSVSAVSEKKAAETVMVKGYDRVFRQSIDHLGFPAQVLLLAVVWFIVILAMCRL